MNVVICNERREGMHSMVAREYEVVVAQAEDVRVLLVLESRLRGLAQRSARFVLGRYGGKC